MTRVSLILYQISNAKIEGRGNFRRVEKENHERGRIKQNVAGKLAFLNARVYVGAIEELVCSGRQKKLLIGIL